MSLYRVVLVAEDPLLGLAADCISPGPSDVEDPSSWVSLDSVPLGTSGLEELSLRVNVDCISPGPSDVDDPSLGVTVDFLW